MARSIFLSLSLSLLILFHASPSTSEKNPQAYEYEQLCYECQLSRLDAVEPDSKVETEGGLTETWNPRQQPFRCAGVAVIRRTLFTNGLLLPQYSNAPQLIYIVKGEGVTGTLLPGCPETFQEPQQGSQGQGGGKYQEQLEQHQRVRRFREGDILALPAGIAHWCYNDGNEDVVAVALLHLDNSANQLDISPRNFYLAGNPQEEFQQEEKPQQQQKQKGSCNNVLCGIDPRLIAEVFNVDEQVARRLQGEEDYRGNIVRVPEGLGFVRPPRESEESQRGSSASTYPGKGAQYVPSYGQGGSYGGSRGPSYRPGEGGAYGGGSYGGSRGPSYRPGKGGAYGGGSYGHEGSYGQGGSNGGSYGGSYRPSYPPGPGGACEGNGLEETFCSMRIKENIGDPSTADEFTPEAGYISNVNSYSLPILQYLGLSAEKGSLYDGALKLPDWKQNAHTILYVIRGEARVQVVNQNGQSLFDGNVREGQVLVVPQNHVSLYQSQSDNFEWVGFKTHANPVYTPLAGRTSVLRALPVEVIANAYGVPIEEAKRIKFNAQETILKNPARISGRKAVA